MNKFTIHAIALALGLAFSAGTMAETMSKDQYKSVQDKIAIDYKSAKVACGAFSSNAKDICQAEAGGREKIAKAELEARYKPSVNATYKVSVAKADAAYSLAKEK